MNCSSSLCKSSSQRKPHKYATPKKKTFDQPNQVTAIRSNDQVCDICAQNVPGSEREEIFAVGKCDHFVCYVCSARLRVVCDQFDCPICREKLDNVIFSNSRKRSYDKYSLKDCLYNEKYKIYFTNVEVMDAFDKLLKYECLECLQINMKALEKKRKTAQDKSAIDDKQTNISTRESRNKMDKIQSSETVEKGSLADESNDSPARSTSTSLQRGEKTVKAVEMSNIAERIKEDAQGLLKPSSVTRKIFPDVFGLTNHLNYVHRLKLCDLCLTHNKLFPFEYSYYTDYGLHAHIKKGELNTSHRGHPTCTLCKNTFFNADELIQHMSREHYYCHLCGRHESNLRIYFLDYDSLRRHFKQKHYLCEKDSCRHEQFTSAFDNMIDFQFHLVQVHGNPSSSLSRSEARQQRTITLDSTSHRQRGSTSLQSLQRDLPPNAAVVTTGTVATANNSRQHRPESIQVQLRQQRLPTRAEFPALGHNTVSTSSNHPTTSNGNKLPTSQFPSLAQSAADQSDASSSQPVNQRVAAGPSSTRNSFVKTLGGGSRLVEQLNAADFPPLELKPKPKTKVKPVKRPKESATKVSEPILTLDQLISASLSLSSRGSSGGKKDPKVGQKSGRSMKQKPLKIQL